MKIYCKHCGIEVTKELVLFAGSEFNVKEGEPYIQAGHYVVSDGEFFTGTEGGIIINLDDLVNVKNHTMSSRLNGCCGLDGCDGPNKICVCGVELGTEKSDCWMPHAMIFEKGNIILM